MRIRGFKSFLCSSQSCYVFLFSTCRVTSGINEGLATNKRNRKQKALIVAGQAFVFSAPVPRGLSCSRLPTRLAQRRKHGLQASLCLAAAFQRLLPDESPVVIQAFNLVLCVYRLTFISIAALLKCGLFFLVIYSFPFCITVH